MAQQWAAGERIIAEKLSTYAGEPVIRETNTSGFTTTETVVDTLVVPVVEGRRYKIVWDGEYQSSTAGDLVRGQIREDSVSGTALQLRQVNCSIVTQAFPIRMEVFWTADATEDKTFVATGDRITGGGTVTGIAVAGSPTSFYAENA